MYSKGGKMAVDSTAASALSEGRRMDVMVVREVVCFNCAIGCVRVFLNKF